ncbi:MAG TPA: hypothetical protein VLM75_10230 [Spirochaetota bacterium]|nr:hypothetical protein [Spirochaetota bacterium]
MKLRDGVKWFVFVLGVCVLSTGVSAQEMKSDEAKKDPRTEYSEAERPEENYLARFQAIEVSERLIKENLEKIYVLKVIASNFKEQGWEGDYQKIYDQYKRGVGLFYKRDVIYSRVELENNKKAINDLFKKISAHYREYTQTLLFQCADAILDLSLDERSQLDPNRSKVVFQNMMRLRIAYGQLDDAQNAYSDGIYRTSILHYRVAKAYGIRIMEELDPVNSKGKFELHKADNLNRVLNPERAKAEPVAK